ncbi:MAG: peptidylprolyl isomerase [Gemmataceae bacterium]
MRERKWTVRGLTGTLVLLWASGGAFGQAPGLAGNKPAASVNGEVITMTELETALKQDGPMAVALPESVRKQQQQVALAALIDETLLRQFLKQNTPPINPKELDARMSDLAAALKQQNKTVADFCRERNQTPAQLKANLAAVLQWRAYAGSRISDPQVVKYYQENKDMFDKVLVRAAEIMLHVSPQADQATRAHAKAQLAQLREEILNKKRDFALTAKEVSQGPTKAQGGDLDWFPHVKGVLPEPLLQTAFSLQPGQISDVLESELGIHILKVIGRKPGEPSDFNKIKEEVRQLCIEEMQQVVLQQLRQSAKIENYLPR